MPGPGDDLTGLDRRLVERTDIQYTCPCPVPVAETSDTNGQYLSSASSSADSAEPTEDCEDSEPANNVGSMADGEVTDNENPANAKRFLPLEYSISHPIEKRLYDPPPASFVPDGELRKRTEPTGAVADDPGAPTAVTSTTTVTGVCSGTDAAQTRAYDGSSQPSTTAEETWTSGDADAIAAAPTTDAYGSPTTVDIGGAETTGPPAAVAPNGSNGLSGAISGVIDGSSLYVLMPHPRMSGANQ